MGSSLIQQERNSIDKKIHKQTFCLRDFFKFPK